MEWSADAPDEAKTLEQQLAEAQSRQAQIKARLAQLEARKKARDGRKRAHGEMSLAKLVLDRVAAQPAFKDEIRVLVDKAALKPHERDAILWLLASFDQPASPREGGSSQATL
jgi:vacuolar-type H+-ATPase subunit E/Vma4